MPTAIRCGTLIDGTGSDPVRGATVILENNTIVSVDRSGSIPRDADVVDAGHLTITQTVLQLDGKVILGRDSDWPFYYL